MFRGTPCILEIEEVERCGGVGWGGDSRGCEIAEFGKLRTPTKRHGNIIGEGYKIVKVGISFKQKKNLESRKISSLFSIFIYLKVYINKMI